MRDPRCLDEEQITENRPERRLHLAGNDDRSRESRHSIIHCRLCNRVDELEQQLRLRTVLLVGTSMVCVVLGSLASSSFFKTDGLTVTLAMAPPISSPSAAWRGGRTAENEQSQVWTMGEKWIETNALLHFNANESQEIAGVTTGAWNGAERMATSDGSITHELRDGRNEASTHGCPLAAPKSLVNTTILQAEFRNGKIPEQMKYEATEFVNLRAAPNNSAKVLTVVAQGDVVQRTGHELGWLQVEYADHTANGIKGWVYSGNLRRVDPSSRPLQAVLTKATADPAREAGSPAAAGS
jgi:hypothetical protein